MDRVRGAEKFNSINWELKSGEAGLALWGDSPSRFLDARFRPGRAQGCRRAGDGLWTCKWIQPSIVSRLSVLDARGSTLSWLRKVRVRFRDGQINAELGFGLVLQDGCTAVQPQGGSLTSTAYKDPYLDHVDKNLQDKYSNSRDITSRKTILEF